MVFVGWHRVVGWAPAHVRRAPHLSGAMEQYGNTSTYNIETVLYQNVQNSEYYKNNCVKLSAIDELIDEVRPRRPSSGPARHC